MPPCCRTTCHLAHLHCYLVSHQAHTQRSLVVLTAVLLQQHVNANAARILAEMKKGVFSVMHYLMPERGVLTLHSGCNVGADGDVTLFFGLSGTGEPCLILIDPALRVLLLLSVGHEVVFASWQVVSELCSTHLDAFGTPMRLLRACMVPYLMT